jgi:hypothetical protein
MSDGPLRPPEPTPTSDACLNCGVRAPHGSGVDGDWLCVSCYNKRRWQEEERFGGYGTLVDWKWAIRTRGRCPECGRRAQLDTEGMFRVRCNICDTAWHLMQWDEIEIEGEGEPP